MRQYWECATLKLSLRRFDSDNIHMQMLLLKQYIALAVAFSNSSRLVEHELLYVRELTSMKNGCNSPSKTGARLRARILFKVFFDELH